jgi:hypothetical protein
MKGFSPSSACARGSPQVAPLVAGNLESQSNCPLAKSWPTLGVGLLSRLVGVADSTVCRYTFSVGEH